MSNPKWFPIPHLPFVKWFGLCALGTTYYNTLLSLQLQCSQQSGNFLRSRPFNVMFFAFT